MPAQVLGGPVWWFFLGIYLLAIAVAAFALFDSQRPARAERFARISEPDWLYAGLSGAYLVSVVVVWIPGIPRVLAVVPVLLTPFSLALSVGYLLRVTFPRPTTVEADTAAAVEEKQAVGEGDADTLAEHKAAES